MATVSFRFVVFPFLSQMIDLLQPFLCIVFASFYFLASPGVLYLKTLRNQGHRVLALTLSGSVRRPHSGSYPMNP